MLYSIGDVIVCKNSINTQCLEMTNPCFDIKPGDSYKITDKDDYPNNNPCHWYELTSANDSSVILDAWNDNNHMVLDDNFTLKEAK